MSDEEAKISKVRYLYGRHGRICGRHKRESRCALPGETLSSASGYDRQEAVGRAMRSQPRPY